VNCISPSVAAPFHLVATMDGAELTAQIDAQPEIWDHNTARRAGSDSPFAGASDIWVRYNRWERFGPNFNDEHVPVWYPAADKLPAARALALAMMAQFQGEMLGGVLITKVPAGARIGRHVDTGWHVDYYDKFYLSLRSAPGADFCFDGATLNPAVGDVWLVDNRQPHWVINNSGQDRMTLIVCLRTAMFGRV
jgi:hypothetical protein